MSQHNENMSVQEEGYDPKADPSHDPNRGPDGEPGLGSGAGASGGSGSGRGLGSASELSRASGSEAEQASGPEPMEPGSSVPAGRQLQASAPTPPPSRQGGLRWFTLLLFATLVLVAVLGNRSHQPAEFQHVADGPPAVLAPTGKLEDAYELARPATLRIEERCSTFHGEATLGMGTGFFVREDGLVLTAYHVIDTSSRPAGCEARFVAVSPDRTEYALRLVGFDAYMDLAMLQADVDRKVPYVPLAKRAPTPGSDVVAIGNSRNDFLQARAGEVTRLGVHAGRADFADNTIELTNALAPGDSGGPVVNERGEVVGVVSYISFNPGAMSSDAYVPPFLRGVALPRRYASYAVPVFDDAALVAALAAGEMRDVPVIGFSWRQGMNYDPSTSDVYLGRRPGTIVVSVQPGGPADEAGLRSLRERTETAADGTTTSLLEADVIVAVDGVPTPGFYDLLAAVRGMDIGQSVTLTVQRGQATFRVPLTLGARRAVFSSMEN